MVYLSKMVIFHGYVSHNQRVILICDQTWRKTHQEILWATEPKRTKVLPHRLPKMMLEIGCRLRHWAWIRWVYIYICINYDYRIVYITTHQFYSLMGWWTNKTCHWGTLVRCFLEISYFCPFQRSKNHPSDWKLSLIVHSKYPKTMVL